jgi:hypothetical protein
MMMMMVYARDWVGGNEYAYSLGTTATVLLLSMIELQRKFYTSVF